MEGLSILLSGNFIQNFSCLWYNITDLHQVQKKEIRGERAAPGWEEEMYYKQYGNTGLKVSAIGLGTMRYDEEDIKAGSLKSAPRFLFMPLKRGSTIGIRLRTIAMIRARLSPGLRYPR